MRYDGKQIRLAVWLLIYSRYVWQVKAVHWAIKMGLLT